MNGGVTGQVPNQLRTLPVTMNQHQELVTSKGTILVETNILITPNTPTPKDSEITPPSLLGTARKIA